MNLAVGLQQPVAGTPPSAPSIRTRQAVAADREVLRSLAPRLVPFGLPPWRDPRKALAVEFDAIDDVLGGSRERRALLVAEDLSASRLGFIHAVATLDRTSGVRLAQVAGIAVVAGRGMRDVANALLASLGDWASARGCEGVTCVAAWGKPIAWRTTKP